MTKHLAATHLTYRSGVVASFENLHFLSATVEFTFAESILS